MDLVFAKTIVTLLFVFVSLSPTFCSPNKTSASGSLLCIQSEKQALLSFKHGIVNDTQNALSSWAAEEEECCNWAGVACDNNTGHVQELRLFYPSISGQLKGKVNPSLLKLTQLSHLDLSSFDSGGAPIPKFIGSLVNLRHLHLSSANFGGMIPPQLGNLSRLQYLDLGGGYFNLYSENLQWLSGLSSLESLYMSYVNLSKASDHWLLAINKLPSLLYLSLYFNDLSHIQPLSYVNFTSLSRLDIWGNNFNSLLPDWIFSLSNLSDLSLHENNFKGPLPNASTRNLCNLESLDLSDNKLSGKLEEAFESLVVCLRLERLDLSNNSFSGPTFHPSLEKFLVLEELDISSNRLNGSFPKNLGSISNLRQLDISDNLFDGFVSEAHFVDMSNLTSFWASGNSLLTLRVSPDWIPPLRDLDSLGLGSWNLGPQFPTWLKSLKRIWFIDLSNTGLVGTVPSWFWNLSTSFVYISLCDNQLNGELPSVLPTDLDSVVYLCSNNFSGTLPRNSFGVLELNLSNNSLSGDISEPLCNWKRGDPPLRALNLRGNVLNLRGNLFSGKIPNCWMNWTSLEVIDLGNNNLIGEIPNSIGSLQRLESLHLRDNNLSGEIPSFLKNCTMLQTLDLGLNKFVGSIPTWLGVNLSNLMFLSVRSNKLNGHIPEALCHLDRLQVLDAADNNLSGTVPSCFENFRAMATKQYSSDPIQYAVGYISSTSFMFIENALLVMKGREDQYDKILSLVTSLDLSNNNLSGEIPKQLTSLQGLISLNLSRNHLRGSIPEEIGNMGSIQALDISWNELSGKMPPSMSNLNFLLYLNVSFNNLSGEIPLSTQLQSFNPSSFIGNQLCGPPLPSDCRATNKTTPTDVEDGDEEEFWFRLGIAVGFAVGFLGVISPLVVSGFYRRAYFWFFQEYLWYKILDCYIKFKRTFTN